MPITFEPRTKHDHDDFTIMLNGQAIGTLYWNRHKPKPGDKVATVRDLKERVAIVADEQQAMQKLVKWAMEDGEGFLFEQCGEKND